MRRAVKVYRGSVEAGVMRPGRRHEPRRGVGALGARGIPRRASGGNARAVLERGIDRGDLRADLDLELALDVLGGPLFYRLLITGGPIDEEAGRRRRRADPARLCTGGVRS